MNTNELLVDLLSLPRSLTKNNNIDCRCPHCNAAKALLASEYKDVDVLLRDLDLMEEPTGPCLAKALADLTGQTSVPNIFIDGKQIGGNSDLQAAHKAGTLNLA